jgi:hypothetical protein
VTLIKSITCHTSPKALSHQPTITPIGAGAGEPSWPPSSARFAELSA